MLFEHLTIKPFEQLNINPLTRTKTLVNNLLTRSLGKGFQKQDLLCIQVSRSFRANNFRNT